MPRPWIKKNIFLAGILLAGVAWVPPLHADQVQSGQLVIEKAVVKLIQENNSLESEVRRLAGESLSYQAQLSELKNAVNDMANRLAALEEATRVKETKVISGKSKVSFKKEQLPQEENCLIEAPANDVSSSQTFFLPEKEEGMSMVNAQTFLPIAKTIREEGTTCGQSESL